jgi:hypothetical protein
MVKPEQKQRAQLLKETAAAIRTAIRTAYPGLRVHVGHIAYALNGFERGANYLSISYGKDDVGPSEDEVKRLVEPYLLAAPIDLRFSEVGGDPQASVHVTRSRY